LPWSLKKSNKKGHKKNFWDGEVFKDRQRERT